MFPFDIITFVYLKKNKISQSEINYNNINMTPLIYSIYLSNMLYFDFLVLLQYLIFFDL